MQDPRVPQSSDKDKLSKAHYRIDQLSLSGMAVFSGIGLSDIMNRGMLEASSCTGCKKCNRAENNCPASLIEIAGLIRCCLLGDSNGFLQTGGMACVKCDACVSLCPENIDLPGLLGSMQQYVLSQLQKGRIQRDVLQDAFLSGKIGPACIDSMAGYFPELT